MNKILITGANGFLGQHLILHLHNRQYNVVATSKGPARLPPSPIVYFPAELTNLAEVVSLMQTIKPDVVVHTAALSKPDVCEANRANCLAINVEATQNLLRQKPARFIYVSTDFIFGENGPHSEEAKADPLNFYGQSKWLAEQEVRHSGIEYAIMRPAFIYGKVWPGLRPTFLQWVKNSLETGKRIKVVSDQLRTPTFVNDLCRGIEMMISRQVTGDFHLAGRDVISPYDMAATTAEVLGLDFSLIENVTSASFPEPVRRSKRSGLTIAKAEAELGYQPVSFAEGVRQTFL
jgi:dTDP-4-dehydrorhamnose reductase